MFENKKNLVSLVNADGSYFQGDCEVQHFYSDYHVTLHPLHTRVLQLVLIIKILVHCSSFFVLLKAFAMLNGI